MHSPRWIQVIAATTRKATKVVKIQNGELFILIYMQMNPELCVVNTVHRKLVGLCFQVLTCRSITSLMWVGGRTSAQWSKSLWLDVRWGLMQLILRQALIADTCVM